MNKDIIGWRVLPRGRVAHWVTWPAANDPKYGDRAKHYTACGRAWLTLELWDIPRARRCVRCERVRAAVEATP